MIDMMEFSSQHGLDRFIEDFSKFINFQIIGIYIVKFRYCLVLKSNGRVKND